MTDVMRLLLIRLRRRLAGAETMFAEGIRKTIAWFFEHEDWMKNVTSGDYQKYYEEMIVDIKEAHSSTAIRRYCLFALI